jgi:heterotetrameric sarcosine oxidase gamma subunit
VPSKVWLRVAMTDAAHAAQAMNLPRQALQSRTCARFLALWTAPDQWLLLSESDSAQKLIEHCSSALVGVLYNATDASAALDCVRVQGRHLLSMGCGMDLHASAFPPAACARTRLAQVPVILHCVEYDQFDVYVDRSVSRYLGAWLERARSDPLLRRE